MDGSRLTAAVPIRALTFQETGGAHPGYDSNPSRQIRVPAPVMKSKILLPPLAALALAGVWLGSQRKSISAVESETLLLRQHVDAAKAPPSPDDERSLSGARARAKQAKDPAAIDWKELATKMGTGQGMIPDMRSMLTIQRKIMAMSAAEINAALEETGQPHLG